MHTFQTFYELLQILEPDLEQQLTNHPKKIQFVNTHATLPLPLSHIIDMDKGGI